MWRTSFSFPCVTYQIDLLGFFLNNTIKFNPEGIIIFFLTFTLFQAGFQVGKRFKC